MNAKFVKIKCSTPAYEYWINVNQIVSVRKSGENAAFTLSTGEFYVSAISFSEFISLLEIDEK